MGIRASREEFEHAVRAAIDSIPAAFKGYMERLTIEVQDRPDRQTLEELGLRDRRELLGLYVGTPLTEQSVEAPSMYGERVIVYRHNIQRLCNSRRQLVDEIRRTVLHEVGHHFGLDEDDLDKLGYG
jgi:predicted Zn-dependent protease with MMP-like domain